MKIIYISLPIRGQEDTYEHRLDDAVEYVKGKYPEYERIITPKVVAENIERAYFPLQPKYKEYLLSDLEVIYDCDAIFMCNGWENSKGCKAEREFADAIGLTMLYQPE